MSENWSTPQYLNEIFRFKSNRRKILLSSINEFFEIDKKILRQVSESFECLHFSATTVDDVLDNETFRNDQPCYYVREGYDKAFVAAFSSFVRFLEISSYLKTLDKKVIHSIREMINSEEADSGLRVREKHFTYYKWYIDVCSTKSSHEILAIIQLLNNIKQNRDILIIKDLFFEIGRYAQMYNDKRDLMNNNPLARFSKNDKVKLTYSLPLAIYIDEIDHSLENIIGTHIEQSEFMIIHKNVFSEFIRARVEKVIEEQKRKINQIFQNHPDLKKPITLKLLTLISTGQYYKSKKHEIFSK